MKVLIIYDSVYGNTEQVARAMADAFPEQSEVRLSRPSEINMDQIKEAEWVIFGSPTQGGKATRTMQELVNQIPESILKDIDVSAFDTRITAKLAGIFGYAAGKMANTLKNRGGKLVGTSEGFFVKGTKGPLKEGELERAATWIKANINPNKTPIAFVS